MHVLHLHALFPTEEENGGTGASEDLLPGMGAPGDFLAITGKPTHWYSHLCNRWLSLIGVGLPVVDAVSPFALFIRSFNRVSLFSVISLLVFQ